MSLNIVYFWNGIRHSVIYERKDPKWREHFQMLVQAGKQPRILYNV